MDLKRIVRIFKEVKDLQVNMTHFCAGSLYYNIELDGDTYQFSVPTNPEEVGSTDFKVQMRATPMLRYIRKTIDNNEFIKVSI